MDPQPAGYLNHVGTMDREPHGFGLHGWRPGRSSPDILGTMDLDLMDLQPVDWISMGLQTKHCKPSDLDQPSGDTMDLDPMDQDPSDVFVA